MNPTDISNINNLIWIIEDDPNDCFVFEKILSEKYQLIFFKNLAEFDHKIQDKNTILPQLVLADLRLPDGNFFNYLTKLNIKKFRFLKYIVVSSYNDVDVLRACFEEGVLDYLTKPFDKNELLVKVERIMSFNPFHSKNVSLDWNLNSKLFSKFSQSQKNIIKNLTSKEFQILSYLCNSIGQDMSRQEILEEIWGSTSVGEKTLDVHLFRLRKKIASHGITIEFNRPHFYKLILEPVE